MRLQFFPCIVSARHAYTAFYILPLSRHFLGVEVCFHQDRGFFLVLLNHIIPQGRRKLFLVGGAEIEVSSSKSSAAGARLDRGNFLVESLNAILRWTLGKI